KNFLFDEKYSRTVKPYSKKPEDYLNEEVRNRGLEPGDVLVVGREWIYHVAIFIDNDLFFEKSGSGDLTLFRFATYDLLRKTWDPTFLGWSFRRFEGDPLIDPMRLFGAEAVFSDDKNIARLPSPIRENISAVRSIEGEKVTYYYFLREKWKISFDELSGRSSLLLK
ncbi:MAG: C40 family peptidase, partial [Oligoflexales bacterium]|nr:C40 family peptidase [Oligoflexales bacterium]